MAVDAKTPFHPPPLFVSLMRNLLGHLQGGQLCWPKGTFSDFVLMITNRMKLFDINKVQVFQYFLGFNRIQSVSFSK